MVLIAIEMSTAGGGKKGPKGSKKTAAAAAVEKDDRATPASVKGDAAAAADLDVKDDAEGEGKKDAKGDDVPAGGATPKPPISAGQTQRDAATKALNLALKQEWTPLEQTLKGMEKMVAAGGEDVNSVPLAGVMDIVSRCSNELLTVLYRVVTNLHFDELGGWLVSILFCYSAVVTVPGNQQFL